jgi:hypothetical protein
VLLVCWAGILVLSIAELIRNAHDPLLPAMLVLAFIGFFTHLALLLRKDK